MDLSQIGAQWQAATAAPVIYIAEAIIVSWLVWWLRGNIAQSAIDGLREQIAVKDERLMLAHEKNDGAKREFESLKAEMDRRERQERRDAAENGRLSRALPSITPPTPDEHSLSTSVHSANLDRLLTDVATVTGKVSQTMNLNPRGFSQPDYPQGKK